METREISWRIHYRFITESLEFREKVSSARACQAEVAVTGMVAVRYRLASYDDDEELCASTTVSIAALDNTHDPLKYRKEDIALGDDFHCSLHGVKGLNSVVQVRGKRTHFFTASIIALPTRNNGPCTHHSPQRTTSDPTMRLAPTNQWRVFELGERKQEFLPVIQLELRMSATHRFSAFHPIPVTRHPIVALLVTDTPFLSSSHPPFCLGSRGCGVVADL
ncbi:hypothetical protein EV421DRAFT_1821551 [Armillaria borealis]|uniref:Uncharacterized protein n=1 Tax=Armillaria borealis TaxID=47425 RepID=A0AA39JD59_9AGAR|nr:hypothetical protein EV421DRAFT_1821551 [Armillaria borealis]